MVLTRAMVKKGVIGEKLSATDAHVTRGTKFTGITIGTLNIVDGRGNRLEMACHELSRHNVDIAVITETKLNGYHTVSSYVYSIVATKTTNQHQGGVAITFRQNRNWHMESP